MGTIENLEVALEEEKNILALSPIASQVTVALPLINVSPVVGDCIAGAAGASTANVVTCSLSNTYHIQHQ